MNRTVISWLALGLAMASMSTISCAGNKVDPDDVRDTDGNYYLNDVWVDGAPWIDETTTQLLSGQEYTVRITMSYFDQNEGIINPVDEYKDNQTFQVFINGVLISSLSGTYYSRDVSVVPFHSDDAPSQCHLDTVHCTYTVESALWDLQGPLVVPESLGLLGVYTAGFNRVHPWYEETIWTGFQGDGLRPEFSYETRKVTIQQAPDFSLDPTLPVDPDNPPIPSQPVPEPSTVVLLVAGLAGGLLFRNSDRLARKARS